MTETRIWLAAVCAAVSLTLSLPQTALADEIDKATQDALQSIITQQIEAFGRDDAATAQSFAAPGIKQKFPDAKDFNDMVHRSYAPLIHPKSTHFDATGQTALGPIQKVTIVDSEGQAWTAVYSFEQIDGQWRINGCALVKEQSTTI